MPSSSSSRSSWHGTPSGGLDDRSLGGEHAVPRRERDGDNVFEATGGEGFEQAGGYHVVHRALVGGQFAGQTLGDDERMVVGDFTCVHAAAVERSPFQDGGMDSKAGYRSSRAMRSGISSKTSSER